MKNTGKKIIPFIIAAVLIFIDQAVKALAVSHLKGKADYPLLSGILEFSYLENTGAAFSSFMGKQGFLITLTICAMLFLILKYFQIPDLTTNRYFPMKSALILIISGGIGLSTESPMGMWLTLFTSFPLIFQNSILLTAMSASGWLFSLFCASFIIKMTNWIFCFP